MIRVGPFGVCVGSARASALALALACMSVSTPARADVDLARSVQLTLDTSLASYSRHRADPAASPAGTIRDIDDSQTSFGLFGSGLGAGASYLFSENVSVGLRTRIQTLSFSPGGARCCDWTAVELVALPRLEILLGSGGLRPFLLGTTGIGRTVNHRQGDGINTVETETASTRLLFGGGGGLHAFIGDHWSIDPTLSLLAYWGRSSSAFANSSSKLEQDFRGFELLLSVGISGWIGGRNKPAPAPPAPARAPAVAPAPAFRSAPLAPTDEADDDDDASDGDYPLYAPRPTQSPQQ